MASLNIVLNNRFFLIAKDSKTNSPYVLIKKNNKFVNLADMLYQTEKEWPFPDSNRKIVFKSILKWMSGSLRNKDKKDFLDKIQRKIYKASKQRGQNG